MRTVAAFDFDGTLRPGDSLHPFLRLVVPRWRLILCLLWASPRLVLVPLGGRHRDRAKAAVLAVALRKMPVAAFDAACDLYAARLEQELRPDVIARARWHQEQGHQVVIVSASPEHYLQPLAERLGFVAVLGTNLERDSSHMTGRLVGANVRGAEKVRRLTEWLVGEPVRLWAYG
ncbi:MAG: HAD family hydrolase, partial [Acidimicrobiales bacterium]